MTVSLDFLPDTAFAFFLIFARVGAMTMALPGIGDRTVPPRIRLVFALMIAIVLFPIVRASLPPLAGGMMALLSAMVRELLIGLAIGFSVRMIISGIVVAGSAIAVQTGLAFAQNVDPTQGVQSTLFSSFLSLLAITLIFATDLHHLLFAAMHDSYILFPVGKSLPVGDFAQFAIQSLSDSFRIAVRLAAPFLAFGLIFFLGLGLLSRLIPQMQVFFVAMPANIFFGFVLLGLLISSMMYWFLDYYGEALKPYLL